MLKWITKNVQSPYRPVQTLHWAVPSDDDDDEDKEEEDEDDESDTNFNTSDIETEEHHHEQIHSNSVYCLPDSSSDNTYSVKERSGKVSKLLRHALESAEDQLGAVL